jgi:hypothetical protein
LVALASACSQDGSATFDSARYLANALAPRPATELSKSPLDPRFRYLRVQVVHGTPALLVLGYVDPHPMGPIEVWYSASGEVLKLQNGRVVATQGLTLDWPRTRFESTPIPWQDIDGSGSIYARIRDEIPRYRYGLRETVLVRPAEKIPTFEPSSAQGFTHPQRYRWFQEVVQGAQSISSTNWFALGVHRGVQVIVFSEQCLAPAQCLSIQPWPLDEGGL